jgi:uncharacterized protein YutD
MQEITTIGKMTGECKNCNQKLLDNIRKANLSKYDGIVEYCSFECLYEDIHRNIGDSKFSKDNESKTPWD